jgi:hypothetical protein
MNIYAALTLSSRKQAIHTVSRPLPFLSFLIQEAYRLKLTLLEEDIDYHERYRLEIYAITYPHLQEDKGWNKPEVASEPHFSKEFTDSELLAFFEKHGWAFNEDWHPFESER